MRTKTLSMQILLAGIAAWVPADAGPQPLRIIDQPEQTTSPLMSDRTTPTKAGPQAHRTMKTATAHLWDAHNEKTLHKVMAAVPPSPSMPAAPTDPQASLSSSSPDQKSDPDHLTPEGQKPSAQTLPDIPSSNNPFGAPTSTWLQDMIAACMVSVVNISVKVVKTSNSSGNPAEEFFMKELRDRLGMDLFGQLDRGPKVSGSLGSGFVIDIPSQKQNEYFVITNHHVVASMKNHKSGQIMVTFDNGQMLRAKIVGTDPASDLAVLSVISKKPLKGLSFGSSDTLRRGDFVCATGNPFGMGSTVTSGIVSYVNRRLPVQSLGGTTHVPHWIQTDAAVNQGNSGGPLLNAAGQVVGINTAIYSPTGGNVGIAFALPADQAKTLVKQLIDKGCITRGYIGVHLGKSVTEEMLASLGMTTAKGVLVDNVKKGQPAHKAGLRSGDIILAINQASTNDPSTVQFLVSNVTPGQPLSMQIWRPSEHKDLTLKMTTIQLCQTDGTNASRHSQTPKSKQQYTTIAGISLREMTPDDANTLDLDENQRGVMIDRVEVDSGALGHLRPGDCITHVAMKPVSTVQEAVHIIQQYKDQGHSTVLLTVVRMMQTPEGPQPVPQHETLSLSHWAS